MNFNQQFNEKFLYVSSKLPEDYSIILNVYNAYII